MFYKVGPGIRAGLYAAIFSTEDHMLEQFLHGFPTGPFMFYPALVLMVLALGAMVGYHLWVTTIDLLTAMALLAVAVKCTATQDRIDRFKHSFDPAHARMPQLPLWVMVWAFALAALMVVAALYARRTPGFYAPRYHFVLLLCAAGMMLAGAFWALRLHDVQRAGLWGCVMVAAVIGSLVYGVVMALRAMSRTRRQSLDAV